MSDVWNQRSHKKWQDDRNQRRRSEDDCRYKYRAQQGDRNASAGTARPTSPGTTIMAATTTSEMGRTINGTARKWKTQAADDRTHTHNRIMIIARTGTVRWTTASHGPTTSTCWKATSGATTAGADRSTSSGLNCCTVAPRVTTLTRTASLPQSAAKHGMSEHSSEGDQSNTGKDVYLITDPRNIVPGSRPYSEVKSRTAPVS